MTDDELKRLLGMNSPLATLSVPELDALIYRIAGLTGDQKAQVEAILVRQEGFPITTLHELTRNTKERPDLQDKSRA